MSLFLIYIYIFFYIYTYVYIHIYVYIPRYIIYIYKILDDAPKKTQSFAQMLVFSRASDVLLEYQVKCLFGSCPTFPGVFSTRSALTVSSHPR